VRLLAAVLLSCAGCGWLQAPDAAFAEESARLENDPPALGPLKLTRLRIDPPRMAPEERGGIDVSAMIWAEAAVGTARLVFHGPDHFGLRRDGALGRWKLHPELPHLRSIAAALQSSRRPANVSVWQVGLVEQTEAAVREEYVKDAAGRPVRAAVQFTLRRPSAALPWTVSAE
jgi:hypothetical protein